MKKLKVAVGINGKFVFLEKFPDDEEHYGLKEMLDDLEYEGDLTDPPGVYMATMAMESSFNAMENDHDAYLVIDKLEPIP